MSTPLSDLNNDDIEEFESAVPALTNISPKKSTKNSFWNSIDYKTYALLFAAIMIGFKVPLQSLKYSAVSKIFYFGDDVVKAFVVILAFVIFQQMLKIMKF